MLIVHLKSAKFDKPHPTILYGFKGYSIAEEARFSATKSLILVRHFDAVLAFAYVRHEA